MGEDNGDVFGWVGATIDGKYRVDEVVGEGGFGVVYRGYHLGLREPVALKCLKLPGMLKGEDRRRFEESFAEEGRLLHRLSRANAGIVQALDLGAAVSPAGVWAPYLVLEWLEGRPLDEELRRRRTAGHGVLGLQEAMELLGSAASALSDAHQHGVAHRDLKPSNLFLARVGDRWLVKVLDFGIAKVLTETASLTRALQATGGSIQAFTPEYGAPEQFDRKYGATGPWTDVFAFALIMVELLTGRPALEGDDTIQLLVASANPNHRPTPMSRGVRVPDAVEAVLLQALAVSPRDRFHHAGEFWQALSEACATTALATARTDLARRPHTAPMFGSSAPASQGSSTEAVFKGHTTPAAPSFVHSGVAATTHDPLPGYSADAGGTTTGPQIASLPQPVPASSKTGPSWGLLIAGAGALVVVIGIGAVALRLWKTNDESQPPEPRMFAAASAPPVVVSAEPPKEPPRPLIAKQKTTASMTADGSRWIDAFAFEELDSTPIGATWGKALVACRDNGLDLCSEDQWRMACALDPAVGKTESWTISWSSTEKWVTRGGGSCNTRGEADGAEAANGRIGLCCEPRAAISADRINDAQRREIATYTRLVEEASNSGSPEKLVNLLADECEFFKTTRDREGARKALNWEYSRWASMDARLVRCDASLQGPNGTYDCETVSTRLKKGATKREAGVFWQRFAYEDYRYTVFGRPLRILQKFREVE